MLNVFPKTLCSVGFAIALTLCNSCTDRSARKIGILPLGNFSKNLSDTVAACISKTFSIKTYVLSNRAIPIETFVNSKVPRFRAEGILRILKDEKPDSLTKIISLIEKDISITKRDPTGKIKEPISTYEDWGVFGLSFINGSSSIVSTYRLGASTKSLMIERLKKVAIHEIGHSLGLEHCKTINCVMRDAAETIRTIDNVSMSPCRNCIRKLN